MEGRSRTSAGDRDVDKKESYLADHGRGWGFLPLPLSFSPWSGRLPLLRQPRAPWMGLWPRSPSLQAPVRRRGGRKRGKGTTCTCRPKVAGGETRLRAARRASSTRLPGYSTAAIRLPAVGHRGSCRPPPMRASHRCAARDISRFHRRAARDFATGRRTAGHETRERDGRMIGAGRYFGYCEI
jgi:hypothetical protein